MKIAAINRLSMCIALTSSLLVIASACINVLYETCVTGACDSRFCLGDWESAMRERAGTAPVGCHQHSPPESQHGYLPVASSYNVLTRAPRPAADRNTER